MTAKADRSDIVRDFRDARRRLKLGEYERYLAEHIAGRVARLLGKRDAEEWGGDDQGDVRERPSGERLRDAPRSHVPARERIVH